jgi:hypothetical protein
LWLVTGEGRPRRYYLRGWFIVSEIESGDDEGFRTRVIGREARLFARWVEIGGAPWFELLRRSQGGFAFGYQAIRDPSLVRALEQVAKRAS